MPWPHHSPHARPFLSCPSLLRLQVVEYVFETIRATQPDIMNLSPAVADTLGLIIEQLPNPLVTRDRFRRMQTDVVLDDMAQTRRLHDLDIEATSMELPGFTFLHQYRSGSHFLDIAGR